MLLFYSPYGFTIPDARSSSRDKEKKSLAIRKEWRLIVFHKKMIQSAG